MAAFFFMTITLIVVFFQDKSRSQGVLPSGFATDLQTTNSFRPNQYYSLVNEVFAAMLREPTKVKEIIAWAVGVSPSTREQLVRESINAFPGFASQIIAGAHSAAPLAARPANTKAAVIKQPANAPGVSVVALAPSVPMSSASGKGIVTTAEATQPAPEAMVADSLANVDYLAKVKKALAGIVGLSISGNSPVNESNIDLSVPESPAFTALGVTPETVVRPESPRAFATALLNGADPNGNLQTGLAVEMAPFLLFAGDDLTIDKYRKPGNYLERFAARTQFSLATTKGTSEDDESVRVALGLRLTPWDDGDPRLDESLTKCFVQGQLEASKELNKVQIDITPLLLKEPKKAVEIIESRKSDIRQKILPINRECRKISSEKNWNASSWSLGVAPTWTSTSGGIDDLESSGVAFWTSFAYGFEGIALLEDNSQAIFHVNYHGNEMVPAPAGGGGFIEQDKLTLAVQVRVTGPDVSSWKLIGGPDFNFVFEAAYMNEDRDGIGDEDVFRYTLGVESKVADDLYLKFSIGTEDGRDVGGNNSFVMGNLKLGFSNQKN